VEDEADGDGGAGTSPVGSPVTDPGRPRAVRRARKKEAGALAWGERAAKARRRGAE
jgi:hypothetical protein